MLTLVQNTPYSETRNLLKKAGPAFLFLSRFPVLHGVFFWHPMCEDQRHWQDILAGSVPSRNPLAVPGICILSVPVRNPEFLSRGPVPCAYHAWSRNYGSIALPEPSRRVCHAQLMSVSVRPRRKKKQ